MMRGFLIVAMLVVGCGGVDEPACLNHQYLSYWSEKVTYEPGDFVIYAQEEKLHEEYRARVEIKGVVPGTSADWEYIAPICRYPSFSQLESD